MVSAPSPPCIAELVIAVTPGERVVARTAKEPVIAPTAADDICARAAHHDDGCAGFGATVKLQGVAAGQCRAIDAQAVDGLEHGVLQGQRIARHIDELHGQIALHGHTIEQGGAHGIGQPDDVAQSGDDGVKPCHLAGLQVHGLRRLV